MDKKSKPKKPRKVPFGLHVWPRTQRLAAALALAEKSTHGEIVSEAIELLVQKKASNPYIKAVLAELEAEGQHAA